METKPVGLVHIASARAGFPTGVFSAVLDDMAVGAFVGGGIATALGLRQDCAAP